MFSPSSVIAAKLPTTKSWAAASFFISRRCVARSSLASFGRIAS